MDIIVIVGPTGVGKTKLSIELAKKLDAEIINGDSVSIYKKLNIGSAKPTKEEMENIPHHLLDIKDVTEDYSVYDYQKDARKVIEELNKKNKNIIIVGGTGLYIKAALYDYRFENEKEKNYNEDLTNEEILVQEKELERLVNIGNQSDISFIIDNIDIYCLELMHNREIRAEMSLISGTILYDKTGEMTDNYDQASRLVLAYKNRYEISNVYELISEEAKTKKKEM